jgi:hypothetical protein
MDGLAAAVARPTIAVADEQRVLGGGGQPTAPRLVARLVRSSLVRHRPQSYAWNVARACELRTLACRLRLSSAMPRRAGKPVTLGDLKKRADCCAACHAPLGNDEPLAWTWARQRIHEACMPIWAFANRGRRALGEWIAEPVRLLLSRHQGRLCSGCLALALLLSLEEGRRVVEITSMLPGFRLLPVTCATCARSTMALCMVPSGEAGSVPSKCTHCSRLLESADRTVTIAGEPYHRACSQVIGTRDRIRASRAASQQSLAQLERARAQLDRRRSPE